MRISIGYDSIIEFNQFSVHGREAVGGFGFSFVLNGKKKAEEGTLISDIRFSLSLSDPRSPIFFSAPSSNQQVKLHNYSSNEQLCFEVILTKEQINAIEEYRQDKGLHLNIGLRAIVFKDGSTETSYNCEDFTIPREEWLTALKNAEFRQTILFEVPLPSGDYESQLVTCYSKAQEFIETGHYKDAVMQCRHIIEFIESERDDRKSSQLANKNAQNREERQAMTAIDRMLSLREQIKNVCQLGAHGAEDFTRSQAKAVLGMTMALLSEPTVGFQKKND